MRRDSRRGRRSFGTLTIAKPEPTTVMKGTTQQEATCTT